MTPEVQQEYTRHLMAVALRYGDLVLVNPSMYGWQDYSESFAGRPEHHRTCALTGTRVREDSWSEFKGTFYEGDDTVHGIIVTGVNCACGKLRNRSMRWTASVSEVAEAVFTELYASLRPSSVDDTPA